MVENKRTELETSQISGKWKLTSQVTIAMLAFWIVRQVVTELASLLLMRSGLSEEHMVYLYQILGYAITIVVAFPIYIVVMRSFGTLRSFHIRPQRKLAGLQLAFFFLLASVTMLVMLGMEYVLWKKGMVRQETLFETGIWNIGKNLIFGCLLMPLLEEVMFRGFMLEKVRSCGEVYSVILTTLFFVMGHNTPINMMAALMPGIVFAVLALRTGGIGYGILLHIGINLLGNLILPGFLFMKIV